jgi:hypothetical protein
MPGWDGLERRINPCSTIVRDWRRALQDEWDADRRRRETGRNKAPIGPEPVRAPGGGDAMVDLADATERSI